MIQLWPLDSPAPPHGMKRFHKRWNSTKRIVLWLQAGYKQDVELVGALIIIAYNVLTSYL